MGGDPGRGGLQGLPGDGLLRVRARGGPRVRRSVRRPRFEILLPDALRARRQHRVPRARRGHREVRPRGLLRMPGRDLGARRTRIHTHRRHRPRQGGRPPPGRRPRDRADSGLHPDRVRRQEDGHDPPCLQRQPDGGDRVHQIPPDGHRQARCPAPRQALRAHGNRDLLAILQGPRQGRGVR